MMEREVTGCSSCPFAFLDDGRIPTCILSEDGFAIGPDQSEDGPCCQYEFRADVPDECPLRKGALTVRLAVRP